MKLLRVNRRFNELTIVFENKLPLGVDNGNLAAIMAIRG
jgi:hypothetical protein